MMNGKLTQRVIGGQNCAPGIAEDGCDALAHKRGPQNFSAGEAGGSGEVGIRCLRVCGGSHVGLLLSEIKGRGAVKKTDLRCCALGGGCYSVDIFAEDAARPP